MTEPLPPQDFGKWAEVISIGLDDGSVNPRTAAAGMRHLARSIRKAQNDGDLPKEAVAPALPQIP